MFENLFPERYRPSKLEDIILTEDNRKLIEQFRTQSEINHLLFVGPPGIGKTSLAKIIVNEILQCQYLYINASDENGIDTIRNKVINFALTKSLDGKLKTIILDEADALSGDAQRALRNVMEEYAGYARFILTGNYKYKIVEPIVSRCISLDLTPPLEAVMKRCLTVLKSEGITLPVDQQLKFAQLVRNNYPDIRKCLNDLWKYSASNKVINIPDSHQDTFISTVYQFITQKKINEIRKFIISSESQIHSDYVTLLRNLFNHVDKNEQDTNKKKIYLLTIAEHLYRSAFVVDQEINTYACCIALINA
jgi:DNA polymerase III delta prime subunit